MSRANVLKNLIYFWMRIFIATLFLEHIVKVGPMQYTLYSAIENVKI